MELQPHLEKTLKPGHWLLLKGSRGERLERLLAVLGVDERRGNA
jgi:UDP-N-acetylmuramyl pentapeptide synthase